MICARRVERVGNRLGGVAEHLGVVMDADEQSIGGVRPRRRRHERRDESEYD